jgi:hypothetical protein
MHSSAALLACPVQEIARVIIKTAGKSLIRSGICASIHDVGRELPHKLAGSTAMIAAGSELRGGVKCEVRSKAINRTGRRMLA